MSKKILIQKDEQSEGIISIPKALNKDEVKKLSFGDMSCQVICKESSFDILTIATDIWELLGLPMEQEVFYDINEGELILKPIVGVYTTMDSSNIVRPIGSRSNEFAKLLTYAKKYGIVMFVFSPENVNWDEKTINGLFYNNGRWFTKTISFPQVVYDRIPNRRVEKKEFVTFVKDKFINEYQIPWFNGGFLNKWDVYRKLDIHSSTSEYLPETIERPTKKQILAFIEKYGMVYIKPKNSSRGLGIQQIFKKKDDYFYCRFHEEGNNKLRRYKTLDDLLKNQFEEDHFPHLLLQQGIHLFNVDHHPVDFRIHTNKDENGKWRVSAIAAKVAGEGSVTTHVTYGGKIQTLHEIFGEEAEKQLKRLSKVATIVSRVIEQQVDDRIAELGIDLGIDQEGRIWVFEANSKPGHIIFTPPHMRKQEVFSKKLLFDYCLYLTDKQFEKQQNILTS